MNGKIWASFENRGRDVFLEIPFAGITEDEAIDEVCRKIVREYPQHSGLFVERCPSEVSS